MTDTDESARVEKMDRPAQQRLITAAARARSLYPGPVGELVSQEILSWMDFGYRLGTGLITKVTDALLDEHQRHREDRPRAPRAN